MKTVVTSFSMTLLQAQAINVATRGVKNRSLWIVKACLDRIGNDEKTQDHLDRATVEELLSALHFMGAIDQKMRWMIQKDWDSRQTD